MRLHQLLKDGPVLVIRTGKDGSGDALVIATCDYGLGTESIPDAPCVFVLPAKSIPLTIKEHQLYVSTVVSTEGCIGELDSKLDGSKYQFNMNKAGVEKILNEFVYELQSFRPNYLTTLGMRQKMVALMISQTMSERTDNYSKVISGSIDGKYVN